jgi:hypothetical protein
MAEGDSAAFETGVAVEGEMHATRSNPVTASRQMAWFILDLQNAIVFSSYPD